MKRIASLRCPYCQQATEVREIHCDRCECEVKGHFQPNEFSFLSEEDLHFLRIFLQFEGRIKEMEAPLGLSYPTIRSRLGQLKERVFGTNAEQFAPDSAEAEPAPGTAALLEELATGQSSFAETLTKIKNRKGRKS
jgi:hypothetical protein